MDISCCLTANTWADIFSANKVLLEKGGMTPNLLMRVPVFLAAHFLAGEIASKLGMCVMVADMYVNMTASSHGGDRGGDRC